MSLDNLRHRLFITMLLVLLMVVTRGHHVISILHVPDASWAVFFIAGVYLNAQWYFLILCVLAMLIDWLAISMGGVSSFCITPAYTMLLPAYASLWLGGRLYAAYHRNTMSSLMLLILITFAAALLAELFSSGGFYFLGGRFNEPTFMGFIERLAGYFPQTLGSLAFYLGIAGVVQVLLSHKSNPAEVEGKPG